MKSSSTGTGMASSGGSTVGNFQVNYFKMFYKTDNFMLESGTRLFDIPADLGHEEGLKHLFTNLLPVNLNGKMLFTTKLTPLTANGEFYAPDFEKLMFSQNIRYLQMFMIQYPAASGEMIVNDVARTESWVAVSKCQNPKKINAMSVYNYRITHLIELTEVIAVGPMTRQMYWHSHYSYLGTQTTNIDLMVNPIVKRIASMYNVSASQILFLWALQRGETVVPRLTGSYFQVETMMLNIRISTRDLTALDYVGIRITGAPFFANFNY